MRQAFAVGQHPEPDAQTLDGREPGGRGEQLGHIGKGADARIGHSLAHGGLVATAFGISLPKQCRDAFEATARHQLLQIVATNDQPALLAVDLAHDRIGHDHAIETAIHPRLQHLNSPRLFEATICSA